MYKNVCHASVQLSFWRVTSLNSVASLQLFRHLNFNICIAIAISFSFSNKVCSYGLILCYSYQYLEKTDCINYIIIYTKLMAMCVSNILMYVDMYVCVSVCACVVVCGSRCMGLWVPI